MIDDTRTISPEALESLLPLSPAGYVTTITLTHFIVTQNTLLMMGASLMQ